MADAPTPLQANEETLCVSLMGLSHGYNCLPLLPGCLRDGVAVVAGDASGVPVGVGVAVAVGVGVGVGVAVGVGLAMGVTVAVGVGEC